MGLTAERKACLEKLCGKFRRDVIDTLYGSQTGHPGGSLSVCEILTALYFEKVRVDPAEPQKPDRTAWFSAKGTPRLCFTVCSRKRDFSPLRK